ncbi:hypothetical protein [Bilifractor porci]|jgi:hypothetical protein|uniref:Uncharacterized protein n=1 Tax=Bilifractor porci TaxID=2606636 RepID=A0A7X2PA28_9FIRM|nr:hypothetical protein [Bilifractor porci]MST82951.1 hypothetical protein [Bilifractor porci]
MPEEQKHREAKYFSLPEIVKTPAFTGVFAYSFVLFFGEALPAEDYFYMVPPVFGRMLHDTGQPAPKERTLRSLP